MIYKVCYICQKKISFFDTFCHKCLIDLHDSVEFQEEIKSVYFDQNLNGNYIFKNISPVKEMLINIKDNEHYFMYKKIINIYQQNIVIPKNISYVTWVPSVIKNRKHSFMIAKYLSKKYDLKLKSIFVNKSVKQSKFLTRQERIKMTNFIMKKNFDIDNLLVVDDITTTFTTVNNIVKLLEQKSIHHYYIFSLAHSVFATR